MEHVRFPLLSREYLVQRVDNTGDDLFNRHPVCKDYVIEALKFHLLTATMPSSSAKCLAAASGLEYFWYQSSPSYFNNFFYHRCNLICLDVTAIFSLFENSK